MLKGALHRDETAMNLLWRLLPAHPRENLISQAGCGYDG